jgi:hypothetical protein
MFPTTMLEHEMLAFVPCFSSQLPVLTDTSRWSPPSFSSQSQYKNGRMLTAE